jgi:hypothetical protein
MAILQSLITLSNTSLLMVSTTIIRFSPIRSTDSTTSVTTNSTIEDTQPLVLIAISSTFSQSQLTTLLEAALVFKLLALLVSHLVHQSTFKRISIREVSALLALLGKMASTTMLLVSSTLCMLSMK